jgi:hypothetical protein
MFSHWGPADVAHADHGDFDCHGGILAKSIPYGEKSRTGFYPPLGDKNRSQKRDFPNFCPQGFTSCAQDKWRVSTAYPPDMHRFINRPVGYLSLNIVRTAS